jgi:hypothetical protein
VLTQRFWPIHRRWCLPLCGGLFFALFLVSQLHRPRLQAWHFLSPAQESALFRRETHAPGMLLYFWTALLFVYRTVDRWRATARGAGLEQLALMGRHSLFCFVAHLPFALFALAINTSAWPTAAQHGVVALTGVCVYLLTRYVAAPAPLPSPTT